MQPYTLAVIPARKGSKRLVDKHRRLLGGQPLVYWSLAVAVAAPSVAAVVFTTDDDTLLEAMGETFADAVQAGRLLLHRRPDALCDDTARSVDVALNALAAWESKAGCGVESLLLLQPTSPLRTVEDVEAALGLMQSKAAQAIVSVSPVRHSPLWMNTLPADDSLCGFLPPAVVNQPSQALTPYFQLNGAIYAIKVATLQTEQRFLLESDCYAYRMPPERSVDIDDALDFELAQVLLAQRKEK